MRNILINLVVFMTSLMIALLAIEGILSIYNPFGFRLKGDKIILPANEAYEIDVGALRGVDNIIRHKRNSLGFRGAEPPVAFDSHLTIIAVGGSTTESFLQSAGKDWPFILSRELTHRFKRVWVNNAGLDGHSTFGHGHLVEDYILKIKPKVILYLIGINDIGVVGNSPYDDVFAYDLQTALRSPFPIMIRRLGKLAAVKTEIGALLLNLYRYYVLTDEGLNHYTQNTLKPHALVDVAHRRVSPEKLELTLDRHKKEFHPHYRQRVLALIDSTRRLGAIPVLITQPTLVGRGRSERFDIDLERVAIDRREEKLNGRALSQLLDSYNDIVRAAADETETPIIDLFRLLPRNIDYYYDHVHFTDEGARQVGIIVAKSICVVLANNYRGFIERPCSS